MIRYPRLTAIVLAAPLLAGVALPVGDVGRDLAPVVRAEVDGRYLVTAYCERGLTASGVPAGPGIVAVDPRVIPLGTRLWIEGYGEAWALDTGSAIQGARLDVWLECAAAWQWGRRWAQVSVVPAGSSNETTDAAPNEEPAQGKEEQ